MVKTEAEMLLSHCESLWPAALKKWTVEERRLFVDRVQRVSCDVHQGRAALDELKITMTVFPKLAHLIKAIRNTVVTVKREPDPVFMEQTRERQIRDDLTGWGIVPHQDLGKAIGQWWDRHCSMCVSLYGFVPEARFETCYRELIALTGDKTRAQKGMEWLISKYIDKTNPENQTPKQAAAWQLRGKR